MKYSKIWSALLICLMLSLMPSCAVFAEEYDDGYEEYYEDEDTYVEETEYIPEAYYDPIETNEIDGWPEGPMVQAASAIVMDLDTNAILYGKNLDVQQYPASITKIMTTLVVLEHCSDLDETFTVGEEVYQIEEDSTNLGIQPGEELTVRQALYGVMLESANDLANAVGVYTAGSLSAFADMMNAKAQELGCINTHFVNPSGLHDADHYTSARDMALIAQAAYANKQFRTITKTTEYVIPATNLVDEDRGFLNHQKILQSDSEYYRSWCTGGKTGFTSDAWNTLVTFGEQDGKRYVCVLLRENGADRAREETISLMEYGFAQFQHIGTLDLGSIPTFAYVMGIESPSSVLYHPEAYDEKVYRIIREGLVTVPLGTDEADLTAASEGTVITYSYHGWQVGSAEVQFNSLPESTDYPFKETRDVTAVLEQASVNQVHDELMGTAQLAATMVQDKTEQVKSAVLTYVEENTLTVVWIGVFVLAVLLILIIILIMRCSREARIQRRRIAEEKARLKAEEEIDRMSAVAIEQQLREAMLEKEAENTSKVQQEADDREDEDKLRETEAILEEISRRRK